MPTLFIIFLALTAHSKVPRNPPQKNKNSGYPGNRRLGFRLPKQPPIRNWAILRSFLSFDRVQRVWAGAGGWSLCTSLPREPVRRLCGAACSAEMAAYCPAYKWGQTDTHVIVTIDVNEEHVNQHDITPEGTITVEGEVPKKGAFKVQLDLYDEIKVAKCQVNFKARRCATVRLHGGRVRWACACMCVDYACAQAFRHARIHPHHNRVS